MTTPIVIRKQPLEFEELPEDTRELCDRHPSAKAMYVVLPSRISLCGHCARKAGRKDS